MKRVNPIDETNKTELNNKNYNFRNSLKQRKSLNNKTYFIDVLATKMDESRKEDKER